MSEFDKEAERERLREKFAAEEEDRASVQHMGELLLQGMTMTDRHCPECGNPLFSDGERTFCPECEREVVESDETEYSASEPSQQEQQAPQPPATDGRGTPRANLETALQRAAAAAASAEDPRTARDHLEAAKAAIEALRTLEGS